MIELSAHKKNRASCAAMLIIRDAEKTIIPCMNSLLSANCFDQFIFVIDTRTKDNTLQLISNFERLHPETKIEMFDWKDDDFSRARNISLKLAKTQYGFWMDDDDILVDGQGLHNLLMNPQGKAYLFKIIITTPEGNTDVIDHLRLFPMVKGLRWELPVHEQIAFSLREAGIKEINTPYRIIHTGYSTREEVAEKHKRNFRILQRHIKNICSQNGPRCDYFKARYLESLNYMRFRGT